MAENPVYTVEARSCARKSIEGHDLLDPMKLRLALIALIEFQPTVSAQFRNWIAPILVAHQLRF
jgi:hypothetical protein